ncbi:MAG TPA: hypothetical protein PKI10_14995, partial [Syntrophorhabdus sp.]|nr:hypothetical protein [Syntrophorhabdus sp.]
MSEYDGWRNSMHEAMARGYLLRYGLMPIGPHRQLADKVMSGAYQTCIGCAGYWLLIFPVHLPLRPCLDFFFVVELQLFLVLIVLVWGR